MTRTRVLPFGARVMFAGAILPLFLPLPLIEAQSPMGPIAACTAVITDVVTPADPPYTTLNYVPATGTWTLTLDLEVTFSCSPPTAQTTKCGFCLIGTTEFYQPPNGPFGAPAFARYTSQDKPCNYSGTVTVTSTDTGLLSTGIYRFRHYIAPKGLDGCPPDEEFTRVFSAVYQIPPAP